MMEKIVILSDHPENADNLIRLLKALFPECEISVVPNEDNTENKDPIKCDNKTDRLTDT